MPVGSRLAAFSIDIEPDYGGFFGSSYKAIEEGEDLDSFMDALAAEALPVTLFITGDLLENHEADAARISRMGTELQVHSHSHPRPPHDVVDEATRAYRSFEGFYGRPPSGYRSPFGYIRDEYMDGLSGLGYRYDSSLFPTFRPGRFSNLDRSLHPERHPSGLWEIPLGCFALTRLVFSVGYLKFFGPALFRLMLGLCGIPDILVIDSHMHDFIPTTLYGELPPAARVRYGRHMHDGRDLLLGFVSLLRASGFEFVTLSFIADRLERERWPSRVVRI
jgi:peptidoglycan/xylan/chitin deacetylase (PgdA/CDA1 family)